MGKIILYHGSPDKEIKPAFGLGENRHDYGNTGMQQTLSVTECCRRSLLQNMVSKQADMM